MNTLEEFVSIDSQFYKIIESWNLLEEPMKVEYNSMVESGDLSNAKIRETMLNSLEGIVEICKDQRICLAKVANEYSINVTDYKGVHEQYDPIDVVIRVFDDVYFKTLCDNLDNFVEAIDTEGKFEKQTYTTETLQKQS